MWESLFWLYMVNSVLLINHEIDSAYWKEWDMFKLPGGIAGFLVIHFLMIFLILYGLVLVSQESCAGLVFSLILSGGGIFAFSIHTFFISRGRTEFKAPISLFILGTMFIVSLAQAAITIYLMV